MQNMTLDPNDIQPMGYELIPTKKLDIKDMEITMLPVPQFNKHGVDNLVKAVDFVGAVAQSIAKAKQDDGKITFFEYPMFIPVAMKVPSLIGSLALIPAEATDLITQEEKEQIAKSIEDLNLGKDELESLIADAVKIVIDLKNFAYKYFVK